MEQVNVLDIACKQSEVEVEKLQEIVELIHEQGNTFWGSAQSFLEEGSDKSILYIEHCGGGVDLNGSVAGYLDGLKLIPFEDWYVLVKASLTGATTPVATVENAAFLTSEAGVEGLQKLLDICHRHGLKFWKSVDDYSYWTDNEEHVTFFSKSCGIDGCDDGIGNEQVLVSFDDFMELVKNHFGEVIKSVEEAPVHSPKPRYRKRRRQKPPVAKTCVRVMYVTQQTYTFKNVRSVQILDDKVFIQHERVITDGIKESAEVEIDGDLVMAVVIHEAGNRSNFFRNIDGTWDFQNQDGTVVNNGQQLGRIIKK